MFKVFLLPILLFLVSAPLLRADFFVVSTKPLFGLVAKIIKNTDHTLELLYDGSYSPHNHGLKIAEALKLEKASLIFWAGEIYESALKKIMESHKNHAVDLSKAPGLYWLPVRHFDQESPEKNSPHLSRHHEHCDHDHADHMWDSHYWLDPQNAIAMIDAISGVLSKKYPNDAIQFEQNRKDAYSALNNLQIELKQSIEGRPYVIMHDSTQYFDHAFGTQCMGVISSHAGGIVLKKLFSNLSNAQNTKIFLLYEPTLQKRIIEKFEKEGIICQSVDYLGSQHEADARVYERILKDIALVFDKTR